MIMNIGDKVRLLHGKEEGIIRRFIDNRLVEIEIEDGFLIPVLKKEIVPLSSEERKDELLPDRTVFMTREVPPSGAKIQNEGIILAIQEANNLYTAWIINHTPNTILFTIHRQKTKSIHGISHGILKKLSYAKIEDWSASRLPVYPSFIIDILQYVEDAEMHSEPLSQSINIDHQILNGEKREIPILKAKGIAIPLGQPQFDIDVEALKDAMFAKETSEKPKDKLPGSKTQNIDLHIEALRKDITGLSNDRILEIQLDHFESALEKAVINGIDEITFIHGVGNGILRNKIHKKLSQYPHIRYFEDAMKDKFGFGATKVQLK